MQHSSEKSGALPTTSACFQSRELVLICGPTDESAAAASGCSPSAGSQNELSQAASLILTPHLQTAVTPDHFTESHNSGLKKWELRMKSNEER